jgi:hypothetical protein
MVLPKLIVDLTNDWKKKHWAKCLWCGETVYGEAGDTGVCKCGLKYEIIKGVITFVDDEECSYDCE